ncbi:MAG: SURF1 family protein [Pseudomonadota bacterium]
MLAAEARAFFRGFRPELVPTLIAVPAILALLGLGTWQWARLVEKNAINALRLERMSGPAIPVPASGEVAADVEFRLVAVTGVFLHDRELKLHARSRRGNAGYHVVTPLVREHGPPVLISRGWVPYERKDAASRPQGQAAGPVTVEGVLRRDSRRGWLAPDNAPARNEWFWYDLPEMAGAAGVAGLAPYYIEAGPAPNPGGFPLGGQTVMRLPNDHLEYALTWYALAVAMAVIYIVYHRRRASERAPT